MVNAVEHSTFRQNLLIVILSLGVFGIINTEMGVVGIVPQIAERFAVSVPAAGWVVSIFALMVAAAAPVMPLLLSRFERRRLMLLILALFTLCNLAALFAVQFWQLLAARALPALLHPVYVSMAFTLAARAAGPGHEARGIARIFVGVSAGMVLGVPAAAWITNNWSYEAAMALFALINALVLAATWLVISPQPGATARIGRQLSLLKRPVLILSVLSFVFINGAMFGFFSFMSDFLHHISGLDFDRISLLLLGYGLSNICGNLIGGRLFDQHRRFYTLALPALMLGLYVLLFAAGGSAAAAVIILLTVGLCAGFVNIAGQYLILSAAPEAPDFANGLFLTAANFGTMSGTVLCGVFIALRDTRFSLIGAFIYLALALIFILLRFKAAAASASPAAAGPAAALS